MLVSCECDFCEKEFDKKRVNIKGKLTFCNTDCKNKYLKLKYSGEDNPNPKKKKINLQCSNCDENIYVHESQFKKQDNFFCCRDCYYEYRSDNYNRESIYNYQDKESICADKNCNNKFKTSDWYLNNKNNLFCSQKCYWKHRKENYSEIYYQESLNNSRKETLPEKMVREWLESNNIKFKQEVGFLRKYFVDFYLPNHKTIIEVYGDYWHSNPDIYDVYNNDKSKKKLHLNQVEKINSNHDEVRKMELESYGFKVKILWEKDIYENLDYLMSNVFNEEP